MPSYLRHKPTGDVYVADQFLIQREDMEPITKKQYEAAGKVPRRKAGVASAKRTVEPLPVEDNVPPPAPTPDPGVDESAGDVASALLSGDD